MQGMRDLLRGTLGRSLRDWSDEDRLAAAWPVVCGSALASRGNIDHLADGVLHIRVAAQEWMQPFLSMRSALRNDLSRIAAVPLSGIHFEVTSNNATPRPSHPAASARRRHPGSE